jgi:hypothetical protein
MPVVSHLDPESFAKRIGIHGVEPVNPYLAIAHTELGNFDDACIAAAMDARESRNDP